MIVRNNNLCFAERSPSFIKTIANFDLIGSFSSVSDCINSRLNILKVCWLNLPLGCLQVAFGLLNHFCLQQLNMKSESYHLEDLEKLYIEMVNQKENPNPAIFKEQINSISRILIMDDKQGGDFFDYVFEVKMLESLLDMFSQAKDKEVVNVILGFFTILLTNLTKMPSVNALLSHPAVACLTLAKFNNMSQQIADYYINFLKVLSRKLNNQNLDLFFNKRYAVFPLLTQSIRFFNHPDNLVRTTCRNIILTFAKLQNKSLHSFMVGFPFCTYFIHESNFVKQYWCIADKIIRAVQDNSSEMTQLDILLQDHQEILIFLDDLLSIRIPGMAQTFISAFINECLSPLMLSLDFQAKEGFSIQICLYILMVLFKSFSNSFVIDALALVVFGKYHTKQLANCIHQPIPCLNSYDKKWKFKGFWDSHDDKISKYCVETYHSQGIKSERQQGSFLNNLAKKIDTSAVFGVSNNFYERQIQKVQSIFGFLILSKNLQRKGNISKKVGAAANIHDMLSAINNNSLKIQDCQINHVSETILTYLNSKDDTLVMLTISLLAAFFHNRQVSSNTLQFCRLSLKPINRDFQSVIKIQKIIISCINIFSVDPPCYRICTYFQARDLCKKLSPFYSPKDFPLSTDIIAALKCGLKTAIDRINPYFFSSKQWERSLMTYMELLKKGNKRRNKNLKVLGLLPNQENGRDSLSIATLDYVYENEPRQFQHQIARDFWVYLIIKELFLDFNSIHNFTKIELSSSEPETCKYKYGTTYQKIQDKMISGQYRKNSQDKYIACELILLPRYLVLIDRNVVHYRASYEQILPIIDRSDPRKLFLKGQEGTIWLQMRQAFVVQALLQSMQEGRSALMRSKLVQIVKEVEDLMKS